MSITISGTLAVKSISGSRGDFSVGDLVTEVGSFRVKDAMLDEFEPGQYKGRFVIGQIFPVSYTWRGKISIEIRAKLLEIFLDDADHRVDVEAQASKVPVHEIEPDPIDEVEAAPIKPAAVPVTATPLPQEAEAQPAGEPDALFGAELQAIIDEGGPVKLDPTIDRGLFRQQRDALKAQGFRFDASAQHWIK